VNDVATPVLPTDDVTTEYFYDAQGRQAAVRSPLADGSSFTVTRTVFDNAGRVTSVVANCTNSGTTVPTTGWESCTGAGTQDGTFNLTTTYSYDTAGNKASETAPNGRVTTNTYDDANRLIRQVVNDVATPVLPTDDVTTEYFYDAQGRQAAVRNPLADGSSFTVTRTVFDNAGRVTSVVANCTNTGTTLDPLAEDPA
jgi:YD repeat-containing protein